MGKGGTLTISKGSHLGGLVFYFIKPTFFYWFIKLRIKYFTFITFLIKIHITKPRAVTKSSGTPTVQ